VPCAELMNMPRCYNKNSIPRFVEPSALLGSPLQRRYRFSKSFRSFGSFALLTSAASTDERRRKGQTWGWLVLYVGRSYDRRPAACCDGPMYM
jgi:hypothetical protein